MKGEAMVVRDASLGYTPQVEMPVVPEGYKQTEVGVIPEDWEAEKLSSIADVRDGTHDSPRYVRDGVPFVTSKNILTGRIDFSAVSYISHEDAIEIDRRSKVDRNDILISMIGTVGNSALVDFQPNFSIKNVGLVKLNKEGCNPRFLTHYLQSKIFKQYLFERLDGGIQKFVSLGMLRSLRVPLPSTEKEQRAIANALSDVDALLEALDRLIAKKRDIKQATMQQLLTAQTRLPGFEGEWEVKRLGEIAHIKTGSRNNEDKVQDGEYPFFVRSENVERINNYSHDCEAILVPGEGRIGEVFHYVNGRFDVHQRVYAITQFKPGVSAKFVYLYMRMKFGAWAMQNTVKATVDSLRLPTFLDFEMLVPPTENEQVAIASILSEMDAELEALQQRRAKTAALKQAMMQELLTGRTRLVEPEKRGRHA